MPVHIISSTIRKARTYIKEALVTQGPVTALRRETVTAGPYQMEVVHPAQPFISRRLVKDNWVVRSLSDPTRFYHFLAHIYHPQNLDPKKPALLLIPGMLCNGNLFRIQTHNGHFRDLNNLSSFANSLAAGGFPVIIIHPRYAEWIYTRFVKNILKVANRFSDEVTIDTLVSDLHFYIEAALSLSKKEKIAVLGFSLGGIELLNLLAFHELSPRVQSLIFSGTPVEFKSNKEFLINTLKYYGQLARFLPTRDYHAVNIFNRNLVSLKRLWKSVSSTPSDKVLQTILKFIPGIPQIFNLNEMSPKVLVPFMFYVLERLPSPVVNELLFFVRRGELVAQNGYERYLDHLPNKIPPTLIIHGESDAVDCFESFFILREALRNKTENLETAIVPKSGHVDLITGHRIATSVSAIKAFLS